MIGWRCLSKRCWWSIYLFQQCNFYNFFLRGFELTIYSRRFVVSTVDLDLNHKEAVSISHTKEKEKRKQKQRNLADHYLPVCVLIQSQDPNNCVAPGVACLVPAHGFATCTNSVILLSQLILKLSTDSFIRFVVFNVLLDSINKEIVRTIVFQVSKKRLTRLFYSLCASLITRSK